MELPVYTSLLRVERRLYQVGQLELPRPVSLQEAGVFLAAFGALLLGSRLLGLGFSAAWAWCYLVLPWLGAWATSQPLADRKRLHAWAFSQLRHLLAEPRLLARLSPIREPASSRISAQVWQPRARLSERPPARTIVPRGHPLARLAALRLEVVEPVRAGRPANGHAFPDHRWASRQRLERGRRARVAKRPWPLRRFLLVYGIMLTACVGLLAWRLQIAAQLVMAGAGGGR